MAKLTLNDITSGYNVATRYNSNNDLVEAAVENTLSRDGTAPNAMAVNLDLGGFKINNLGAPTNDNDAVRLIDVANIISSSPITISPTVAWATGITGIPATVSNIGTLVDPNADRLVFWDDSAGALVYLTLGTGLSITGTTISSTAASVAWSGVTSVPAYVTSLGLLVDPNADRILFWDDSATNIGQLTVSTGLNITGTSLTLSHLGIQSLVDPNADRIAFWDDSAGTTQWLAVGTGLSITGTTISADAASAYVTSLGLLSDPGIDRIIFWDDSATNLAHLTVGTNLAITGTSLDFSSITGSFTGTLTGVTSGSGTIKYTRNGGVVHLEIPVAIVGTPNSTAHTITGAPAAIFPVTAQHCIGITRNNNVAAFGKVVVETTGVLTLYNALSAVFTNATSEGLEVCSFTYHLS